MVRKNQIIGILKVNTLVFLLLCFTNSNAQSLNIAIIRNTPDQKIAAKILTVVYEKLGISVRFIEQPGKRSLKSSSAGILDGETARIYSIGNIYPTLIRVPTSYISLPVTVFSKNHQFTVSGWSSLKNHDVAMVRGMQYAKDGLKKGEVEKIHILNDVKKMMLFLDKGRADVAISSQFNGRFSLKEKGINSIYSLSPPITELKIYHYLHVKHKSLIPKVDQQIRLMKKNGELKRLEDKFVIEALEELN